MAFRERTVTGFVVDADGTPIESGNISFQLDKPLGYTSTHIVINRIFTAVTDALGEFSVTLWCDEDSLLALNYNVSFPIANSGQPQSTHTATISLAFEDGSDKDLGTLIAQSTPPPSEVPLATWQTLIEDTIEAASLNTLGDVVVTGVADGEVLTWDSGTSKWVNAAGGGMAIGGAVSSGTSGSLLFVSGGNLAQNNSKLFWDNTANKENLQITSGGNPDDASLYAGNVLFDGSRGFRIRSTGGAVYYPDHFRIENAAYGTFCIVSAHDTNGLSFYSNNNAKWAFSSGLTGGVSGFEIQTSSAAVTAAVANVTTGYATQRGFKIKLAAAQTADAFQIEDSSSVLLTAFAGSGAWKPASMADGSAPNGSVYYSTTASKLVYKDSGGTVNNLY